MAVTTEVWINAALDVESRELARLIAQLPSSSAREQAVDLAGSTALDTRVYAMRAVSQDHSVGGDPQIAVPLATAGMRFCMHCADTYGPGTANSFIFGVGQFALDANRIYDRMDAHDQQLAIVEDALTWLQAHDVEEQYLVDLRFARIEGLIETGRLEDARAALDSEAAAGRHTHHLFNFLDSRLSSRLASATGLKDRRTPEQRAADERRDGLDTALESMKSLAPAFGHMFSALQRQLDDEPNELSKKSAIEGAHHLYRNLAAFMDSQAGGSGGQYGLNATIQQVSAVLADEARGHDPLELRTVMRTLEDVRARAEDQGFADTAEDTLWPLYICYKRLGNRHAAIDALQAIRRSVQVRREQISDPMKRAGIASQYPHLHVELCARLLEDGDGAGMLSVMEEAKGRTLADSLAIAAARDDVPWPSGDVGEWLPARLEELGAHYLDYLVDTDDTYAVLVTPSGDIQAASLSLGEASLERLRRDFDPSRWGKPDGIFGTRPDDVAYRLAPLVSWLEPLVESGVLTKGDHICYAPDGPLHLVPLHYVEFMGEPLVRTFTLSRTHCASLLWSVTEQPVGVPEHSVAVMVPTADEALEQPEKVEELARAPRWLEQRRGAEVIPNEEADLTALAERDLSDAVVHFATHGVFPDPASGRNPYEASGLVLARGGALPVKGGSMDLLTPERLLDPVKPLDFHGSHVTLQACVSGLSEEGQGGDALGLEWSLLMAGARTVLSTHWHVPAGTSAEFSMRFYAAWLEGGMTKAEAWRDAMLSLMDEHDPFDGGNAYHWAPYSLAGDWR